jgi:hypothetical protein
MNVGYVKRICQVVTNVEDELQVTVHSGVSTFFGRLKEIAVLRPAAMRPPLLL